MHILSTTFAKLNLVIALLVAMTGTGFAHRVITMDVDPDLISYVAAGGALSDICDDASGGTPVAGCDACRLVDNIAVPPVAISGYAAHMPRGADHLRMVSFCAGPIALHASHPVRAPPFV